MMYDYNKKERYNKRGSIVEKKKNGASIRFDTIEFSVTLFTFVHYTLTIRTVIIFLT